MQWRPEPYLTLIYQNQQFWQFPESLPIIVKGTFQQMFPFVALVHYRSLVGNDHPIKFIKSISLKNLWTLRITMSWSITCSFCVLIPFPFHIPMVQEVQSHISSW